MPDAHHPEEWSMWAGLKVAQLITIIDAWQENGVYYERLQATLDQEILVFHAIQPQHQQALLSRRQALITLATLPATISLVLQQHSPSTQSVEKILARCAASITALWHLLKGNELALVEQIISTYLLMLVNLAQQPSRYQKDAAKLASQAYRLVGIVALHRNNLQAREYFCQQALLFSKIAEDKSVVVSAYISLASTFYYQKDPRKAAQIYQEALIEKEHISPLQLSRIYAELAVVYAQQNREQEALSACGLAQDLYPEYPENDPSSLYAEFSRAFFLLLEEGLTYLALAKHHPASTYHWEAWNRFAPIEPLREQGKVPERIFYEITNHQAETALLLGEQDRCLTYLEKGKQGVHLLQSRQRRQELDEIATEAAALWPNEHRIKAFTASLQTEMF